ncbi:hypothetical protein [Bordetella bronchiseptica]|uniref:hypothetical protein n=1 Tax=Bordetella bronchiseptica TaxID=518 RepID=UPI0012476739|nr:hypothetical protein [Bordetella bronchiseptica]KAB1444180.1 hypothetical protein F7D00_21200 [Bordetella bronchiseptica]KAB1569286.1 hypothetical protein F7890_21200 [Bordetella bronchiseptica]
MIKFIRAIQQRVLKNKGPTTLDFSLTTMIYAPGALLLFAEIDRIISLSELPKPITIKAPRDSRPRQVLKQLEFPLLCGDTLDVVPDRDDVVYWRCTWGSDQSGEGPGTLIDRVAERANEFVAKSLRVEDVWRGVSEAIINTTEHAYSEAHESTVAAHPSTRWWLLTCVKDSGFTAAVCDTGVGYRRTTLRTIPAEFFAAFKRIVGQNPDVTAIRGAMEYGKSRTGLDERGKGSRDALSVLKRHGSGELAMISNRGQVFYKLEPGQDEPVVTTTNLPIDIRATLVWWHLPLNEGDT